MEQSATTSCTAGHVQILSQDDQIIGIRFVENTESPADNPNPVLEDCLAQLQQYLRGDRKAFDSLPLKYQATDFQNNVWDAVSAIPYGETATYADIAERIGQPDAVRAVGTAIGKNPFCILVPCHRIVPKTGGVGEYAWGSWRKQWLLDMEGAIIEKG